MTNTQLTLIQIDNYGPWTVSPSPRREADLQTLQAGLYADLSQFVGSRDGYAFFTRFDNIVAVTNGMEFDDHALVQESIGNRYPVTVSLSVATDSSPVQALGEATETLQEVGSAQASDRREVLYGRSLPDDTRTDDDVQIAHFDIVGATERYTDELNAIDALIRVQRSYVELLEHMRETNEALSFFIGGDNFVAVCPSLDRGRYADAVRHVETTTGVELQVGIGRGPTARDAGTAAKHALEECRQNDSRIERSASIQAGD